MTDDGWLAEKERGNPLVMRATVRLARLLGRRGMRPLVSVIAFFYRVFDRRAAQASREWLTRVRGEPAGFWDVYRHLRTFAQVTCDRIFLAAGELEPFDIERFGSAHLRGALDTGRGAVLLGAHLGSYEAMRASSVKELVPIKILGYFENAQRINALLRELDPDQAAELIHIGNDPMSATLKAKAAIDRGELVAIHGDRVGLSATTVQVDFFGEPAHFPTGPFLLASLLRCPVFMVFGHYHEPNRYELHCEPFADRIDIPRRDREAGLRAVAERYAENLERNCRQVPDNWFNFFDFWKAP